jgi:hypothetical protein
MSYTGMLLFSAQRIGGSSLSTEVLSRKKHPNRGMKLTRAGVNIDLRSIVR